MPALQVILLIMNCDKYLWKSRMQKESWLKDINIPYYHVLGDPLLESEFRFSEDDRVLYVKTKDDYNSLPVKVVSAYEAIIKTRKVDYIFKTDDDQFVKDIHFFNVLIGILVSSVPKMHYGGYVINVKEKHISAYYKIHPELPQNLVIEKIKYCSGRFYFLSLEAATHLINTKQKFFHEHLEDYAVGLYLQNFVEHNIMPINTSLHFKDFIF